MVRSDCQNPLTGFLAVSFLAYGTVWLEFFQKATAETLLKKKQPFSFSNLADSLPYQYIIKASRNLDEDCILMLKTSN